MKVKLEFDDEDKNLAKIAINSVEVLIMLMDLRDKIDQLERAYEYPEDAAKRSPIKDISELRQMFYSLFAEHIELLD